LESAHRYQRDFRHSGRPIRHNKLIGTTLLVKGLEYDHAIILEADSMTPKELYVALTRGAKSITIVTLRNVLPT
jgi:DNA helicase-2/ATP-dependent DNA helicase PcrA